MSRKSTEGWAEDRDQLLLQAVVAFQGGRLDEAERLCQRIHSVDPRFAPALQLLGMVAGRTNRQGLGIKLLREAAALDRASVDARNELATLLCAAGKTAEAIIVWHEALRLKPDDATIQNNLGLAYITERRLAEAVASFQAAIATQPDLASLHFHLAVALQQQGRDLEAIAAYRQALSLAPDLVEALVGLGNVLQQLGQFEEAAPSFERAIALQPRQSDPYLRLLSARKVTETDRPLVSRMTSLLRDGELAEQDRLNIHYGLGKAFDDLAEYNLAMEHFDEANRIAVVRLRRARRSFDRKQHATNIDRIITTFTKGFFARHQALGSSSELPVFVLGMIRSGTTLVEQIVSSHPSVGAGGELRFWGERAPLMSQAATGALNRVAARRLADDYCALLRTMAPTAPLVTDKMPTNFLLIGLIHLIFPRARIIHCRRHPLDTCLSIYVTPYANMTDFAHDRVNIVAYYRQYQRLMAHWRALLPPDRFLEVDYEDLVEHREAVTRRLIAFCGLEWDDRCLHHERNPRIIRTPSKWQARQPVYRSSVARWRRYERWLREFRELLPEATRDNPSEEAPQP